MAQGSALSRVLPLVVGALVVSSGAVQARGPSAEPNPGKGKPRVEARSKGKDDSKAEEGKGKGKGKGKDDGKGKKRKKRGGLGLHEPPHRTPSLPLRKRAIACPDDMVAVAGTFCIDRHEATLVEVQTHEPTSPHYPPSQKLTAWSFDKWQAARNEAEEGSLARLMALPAVPEFQKSAFKVKAMSWPGNLPNGYVSGEMAAEACKNAGKRLCKEAEWVTACRGEKQTPFPYGAKYRQDGCNVFREDHPAHILHGDASANHSDPRLNLVESEGKPLLRVTGGTASCASKWGEDEIYDMVGNVDEWVDDPSGTFVGGFYSRATRRGCDARVTTHPYSYFDYSTGVRCCQDPG